jgi:hypothetical protein
MQDVFNPVHADSCLKISFFGTLYIDNNTYILSLTVNNLNVPFHLIQIKYTLTKITCVSKQEISCAVSKELISSIVA